MVGEGGEREGDGVGVGNGGNRGEEENVEETEKGRRRHGRSLGWLLLLLLRCNPECYGLEMYEGNGRYDDEGGDMEHKLRGRRDKAVSWKQCSSL